MIPEEGKPNAFVWGGWQMTGDDPQGSEVTGGPLLLSVGPPSPPPPPPLLDRGFHAVSLPPPPLPSNGVLAYMVIKLLQL